MPAARKKSPPLSVIEQPTDRLLSSGESYEIEFKSGIEDIKSVDLVSFANSDRGGVIIAGVREDRRAAPDEQLRIVGCDTRDEKRRSVQDRARHCITQVEIGLVVEKFDGREVLRVNVPSSQFKPHCTLDGTYAIRRDGQRGVLDPPNLLRIFAEMQRTQFAAWYREAARLTQGHFDGFLGNMLEKHRELADAIAAIDENVGEQLAEIASQVEQSNPIDAWDAQDLLDEVRELREGLTELTEFIEEARGMRDELEQFADAAIVLNEHLDSTNESMVQVVRLVRPNYKPLLSGVTKSGARALIRGLKSRAEPLPDAALREIVRAWMPSLTRTWIDEELGRYPPTAAARRRKSSGTGKRR